MYRSLSLLILALALSACTTTMPRQQLPYPLTNDTFGDKVKVVSIPLPVVASSPNEGVTIGALGAFLLHNAKDEVSTLIAPQLNHNPNFGTTVSLYGAFYPLPDRRGELNLSRSTHVNYDYEARGRDKTGWDGKLELNMFFFSFADGSARFFGFQAQTPRQRETNYADEELGFNISGGYDVTPHLQVLLGDRLRRVEINGGAVSGVPFIRDLFQDDQVPGLNGFTTHAQRISLIYSSLDAPELPTTGYYARATVENSSRALASSANYQHYEGEVKGFIPRHGNEFISVFRLMYNQTIGNRVPFLEQSILGGETTLRGYGRNRFIDSGFFLVNLEERIRVARWEIFNVTADWELAPFMDFGSVMESLDNINARTFEFNPGLGLRAVVRPNIIGRVDVGFGREGPAVFVGLGYPF